MYRQFRYVLYFESKCIISQSFVFIHCGMIGTVVVYQAVIGDAAKLDRAPADDRKVAGSILELGISLLCPWKRHFNYAYFPLGPSILLVVLVAMPD